MSRITVEFKTIHPDVLAKIACPVLVLQGADDEFGSIWHLQAIKSAIADVQHECFPNTGHLPHREQADRVLNRVGRFLVDTTGFAICCDQVRVHTTRGSACTSVSRLETMRLAVLGSPERVQFVLRAFWNNKLHAITAVRVSRP